MTEDRIKVSDVSPASCGEAASLIVDENFSVS
jgi:hypothetical protein